MKTEHLLSGFILRTSSEPLNPTIPESNTLGLPAPVIQQLFFFLHLL